jgi:hypothetical protein
LDSGLALEAGITINFVAISEQDPVRYLVARNVKHLYASSNKIKNQAARKEKTPQ